MTLFSNGTEGDVWQDVWCYLCANDHSYHPGGTQADQSCPIWLRALDWNDPEKVPELVATGVEDDVRARWYCTSFKSCHQGDCEGDDQAEGRGRLAMEVGLTSPADS